MYIYDISQSHFDLAPHKIQKLLSHLKKEIINRDRNFSHKYVREV